MKKISTILLTLSLLCGTVTIAQAERVNDLRTNLQQFSDNYEIKEITKEPGDIIYKYSTDYYTYESDGEYGEKISDFEGNNYSFDIYSLGLFTDGFAPAQKYLGGKWGFIDTEGRWVIKPEYNNADNFYSGLAQVYKNGKNGYIDKTGKVVYVAPENSYLTRFNEGYALECSSDKVRIIDTNFNTVSTIEGNNIWGEHYADERFILSEYNENGESVVKVIDINGNVYYTAKESEFSNFIDGKALVRTSTEENYNEKLIDINGNVLAEYNASMDNWIYFNRVGNDFIVGTSWYGEEEHQEPIVNIYNDNFELIYSINNYYAILNDTNTLLLEPVIPDEPCFFIKKKDSNEKFINTNIYSEDYRDDMTADGVMVFKENSPKVYVDGRMRYLEYFVDKNDLQKVFIYNDRTMVPIRFIGEQFGGGEYFVQYYEENGKQTVVISGNKQIYLTINDTNVIIREWDDTFNTYSLNTYTTDVAPMIVEERTYVPIRFVSEVLGFNVEWDDRGYVIVGNKSSLPTDVEELFSAELELENYPNIDGSTATLPLSYALTSKMLNVDFDTASSLTNHTKTENAFNNFLDGTADLLITGKPNSDKINRAKEAGKDMDYYTFAKDAFVFIVNKDNPVDSLTTEQIKKIYSGEITNWKEVGGKDEEIMAYQRNEDSGSQNLMKKFMGDTPLMPAKTELINGMDGIIEVVEEYDNGANAIGYTVNYYFSEMYAPENVKTIKLDGVEPSDDNIRNGIYPQTFDYSVIYDKSSNKIASINKILDFLKSDDGKKMVSDTHFVSVD